MMPVASILYGRSAINGQWILMEIYFPYSILVSKRFSCTFCELVSRKIYSKIADDLTAQHVHASTHVQDCPINSERKSENGLSRLGMTLRARYKESYAKLSESPPHHTGVIKHQSSLIINSFRSK